MKHFDKFLPPEFAQKLRRIKQCQRTVSAALPPEFEPWVKVGDIDGDCLTLVVSKQSIAANIRFHAASLQRAIRKQHGIEIRRTRVRMSQETATTPPQSEKSARPSRPPQSEQEQIDRERLRRVLRNLRED